MDKFAYQICVAAFLLLGLAQGMTMGIFLGLRDDPSRV